MLTGLIEVLVNHNEWKLFFCGFGDLGKHFIIHSWDGIICVCKAAFCAQLDSNKECVVFAGDLIGDSISQ